MSTSTQAHKLDVLDFFKAFTVHPDVLPDYFFGAVGRTVHRDVGGTAVVFRMLVKFIDYNFLSTLTANTAHTTADFKRHDK